MSKFTLQKMNDGKPIIKAIKPLPWLILGAAVLTLGVYIWQTNSLVSYGYKVRDLEKAQVSLKDKSKTLENQVVRLRSIGSVQEKINRLSFVQVKQVEYINPVSNVFAQR